MKVNHKIVFPLTRIKSFNSKPGLVKMKQIRDRERIKYSQQDILPAIPYVLQVLAEIFIEILFILYAGKDEFSRIRIKGQFPQGTCRKPLYRIYTGVQRSAAFGSSEDSSALHCELRRAVSRKGIDSRQRKPEKHFDPATHSP